MENKIIEVRYQQVCGRDFFYPHNDLAQVALTITRKAKGKRKAFTIDDIQALETLGVEVRVLKPKVVYERQDT